MLKKKQYKIDFSKVGLLFFSLSKVGLLFFSLPEPGACTSMLQPGLLGPILAPLGADSAQLVAIVAQLCGILLQLGAVSAQLRLCTLGFVLP